MENAELVQLANQVIRTYNVFKGSKWHWVWTGKEFAKKFDTLCETKTILVPGSKDDSAIRR